MNEIADLLEKLKPLDRNLYDGLKLVQAQLGRMDLLCSDDIFADFVQGEVQRTITAKGWAFQIAYYPPEGPTKWSYRAYIWPRGTVMKCAEDESPVSALLACYIACLESHP